MTVDILSGLTQAQTVSSDIIKLPLNGTSIKFKEPYDHEAHKSEPIANDFNSVQIDRSVTKEGRFCQPGEWAVVKWKAFSEETGEETNTNEKNPTFWKIGEYKVSKCWEIAISQLRPLEKAMINCPRDLIDQGLDKTDDVINKNRGRKYEFEVQECDQYPAFFKPEKITNDKCFYIKPSGVDGQGSNLALTVDSVDLYYPESYGIYNIQLKEFAGDRADNKAQQFTYNGDSLAIKTKLHSSTAMFEGANKNVITYESLGMDQQKFVYDRNTKIISNTASGLALQSETNDSNPKNYRVGKNIVAGPLDTKNPAQRFEVVYCNY